MFIAPDLKSFQELFVSRLHRMLSPDELGAFILVLANAMQDEVLHGELIDELEAMFAKLKQAWRAQSLRATHDDLLVFEQLLDCDIRAVPVWQTERHGTWLLLNNPMRALRPPRAALETVDSVHRLFDESRFNFNKPFLRPEILWEGAWCGTALRVLYNKFPFAPYHTLIVPDPENNLPQLLTEDYHRLIWDLVEQQQAALPGFAVAYNSLGACASVNHLHFQGFVQSQPLPIEDAHWQHNGGGEAYPMVCEVFDSMQQSWQRIDDYNRGEQPYHILYRPGCCTLVPRQMQGSRSVNARVQGAAWFEASGVFSIADWGVVSSLTTDRLSADLRSLSR